MMLPMSGPANERLSSSSLTAWPFDTSSGVPASVCRLFSDMVLYEGRATGDDPAVYSLSVVDDRGRPRLEFVLSAFGSRYTVSVRPDADDGYSIARVAGVMSAVVDNSHVCDSVGLRASGPFPLSMACVVPGLPALYSLSVWSSEDGKEPVLVKSGLSGDVGLICGHNIEMSESSVDDAASKGALTVAAQPNAGLGVVKCSCPEDTGSEEATGSLRPNSTGGVVICGDGCVSVDVIGGDTIKIDGRCPACCPMDGCESKAKDIKVLSDGLRGVFDMISGAKDELSAEVRRRNAELHSATEADMSVEVSLAVTPELRKLAGTGITGNRLFATTNVVLRNESHDTVATATVLSVSIAGGDSFLPVSTTVDGGDGTETVDVGANGSVVSLDPRKSGGVVVLTTTYRVSTKSSSFDGKKYTARALVHFSWNNVDENGAVYAVSSDKTASVDFKWPSGKEGGK